MTKNTTTSALVDGLLKALVTSGSLATALVAPNMILVLDKPLQKFFNKMDKRESQREVERLFVYMKRQKLVSFVANNYEHGILITKKGHERTKQSDFRRLKIPKPSSWDGRWRLIFFDIPENYRNSRISLTRKLRDLGFQKLQQSIWIYPYPCRKEIEIITEAYALSRYVSYIETSHIDHEDRLIKRFPKISLIKSL